MTGLKYGVFALITVLFGCGSGTGSEGATARSGETTYQQFCFSCHAAGVAGAPKLGDAAVWAPRIAAGEAVMLQRVIEGIPPGMPPRGLCTQCTDADLAAAIDYMVGNR